MFDIGGFTINFGPFHDTTEQKNLSANVHINGEK